MRLIIFSQPGVFIRGHLHAQLEHGWWHRAITIPPHLDTYLRPNATGMDHLGNPCFCLLDQISRLKSIYHKFTPKSSTSVPSTCGSPSPCADTSFCHPREYLALQPPSDFLLISITRTGVTLALIQGSPFPTPSRLGRAHTSTCPAAASRSAHSALDRLGTPGCVGSGQRFWLCPASPLARR